MPWIGIKRSGVDKKGTGISAKRNFNPCDLIGILFGSICDKEAVEGHNKSIDYFKEFVVNMLGDNMENDLGMESTLGMGIQCVNDRSQSNG